MADQGMVTGVDLAEEIEEGLKKIQDLLMGRLDSLTTNLGNIHVDMSGELNDLADVVNNLGNKVEGGVNNLNKQIADLDTSLIGL